MAAASGGSHVAVEADGVDAVTGLAWSVVIKGPAAAIEAPENVWTPRLYLFPWQAGKKTPSIRVSPDTLTGRRFKVTPR